MRPEFETYSEIDNYLNGKLSEQENIAFEKRMEEDSELHELVFDRKVMQEILIENRFFEITSPLRTAPSGYQSLLSKSVKRFLGIGAAITVFLFTPYYFIQQQNKTSDTKSLSLDQEKESEVLGTFPEEQIIPAEEEVIVEEFVEENTPVINEETEVPVISEPQKPLTEKKAPVKKKSGKKSTDNSYVVEIPIDDPSASDKSTGNTHHFNPSKGDLWTIPLKNHKEANLKIFTKEGVEVFGLHVNDKNNHWNGLSNQGIRLKSGKYLYVLDFGNGNIEHGHVVINP